MSFDKRNEEIRRQRELRRTKGKKASIKKKKPPRKKRKNKALPITIFVGLIIAVVLAVLSLTVFFKASNVVVKGDSRYDAKQIISAANISSSQNMILLNKSEVEDRIIEKLPYIGNVNVKINLFNSTVTLEVSETEPFAAVQYDQEYLLIDSSGKFLEKTTIPTCRKVYVEKVSTPEIGKILSFGEENEMSNLINLSKTLEKLSVNDITAIDLSDASDIRLLYKDMQIWKLGRKSVISTVDELEYKLKFCVKLSQSEEGKMGIVDVGAMTLADSTKYGYFREEVVNPEEFVVKPEPPNEGVDPESSEPETSQTNEESNVEDDEDETLDNNQEIDEETNENEENGDENTANDGENDL